MDKMKNLWITQQEEQEFLMDEQRQKRIEALEEEAEARKEAQLEFDFERDQGARE
jgi:hypothetical protein